VSLKIGVIVIINPEEIEGRLHNGKQFIVNSDSRDLCGTQVVALNNMDGSRFSAGYDLSRLQAVNPGE